MLILYLSEIGKHTSSNIRPCTDDCILYWLIHRSIHELNCNWWSIEFNSAWIELKLNLKIWNWNWIGIESLNLPELINSINSFSFQVLILQGLTFLYDIWWKWQCDKQWFNKHTQMIHCVSPAWGLQRSLNMKGWPLHQLLWDISSGLTHWVLVTYKHHDLISPFRCHIVSDNLVDTGSELDKNGLSPDGTMPLPSAMLIDGIMPLQFQC